MKKKKQDLKGKESGGKRSLKQAVTMATVVASLGASLGVNVADLLAADLSATDPCGDLTQISLEQRDLTYQAKALTDQQRVLLTQVNDLVTTGRIYPLSQFTVLKGNVQNLMSQIKGSHDTDYRLQYRIRTDGANITTKVNSLQTREITLADQIKTLEANQLKLMNLLQQIRVDQNK